MSEVTYASLATLRKSSQPRPATQEAYGVVYSDLQNIFQRPVCERCGNLVDEHERMLEQPMLAAAAAIILYDGVPSNERARYNSSLFSVALLYDEKLKTYRLPEAIARTGERLDVCSERSAEAAFDITLDRAYAVSSHGNTTRARYFGSPTVTVLHALPVEDAFDLPLFNLREVLHNRGQYPLERDHRDMIVELAAWLKLQVNTGTLRRVFRPSTAYAAKVEANPCYHAPNASVLDAPLRSFVNPYFKTGELKPKPGDENYYRRTMPFIFPDNNADGDYESSTDPRKSVRKPAGGPDVPVTIDEHVATSLHSTPRSVRSQRTFRSQSLSRPNKEDTGVVSAAGAVERKHDKDFPRHNSHDELVQADFNPLADDFQGDFSNPLANAESLDGSDDSDGN
eukprot:TRINITY_DN7572_c0_g1_i1.p1 TRINITY_DN7572_c0_g1~~TRINITY_DN7572_c0_g1_i1.p1  ORF type:complete len:397 (+),score=52.41 TRINITY_DN7572_c0_g1_i1:89-1279(+)